MSDNRDEQTVNVATVARDERLLDALVHDVAPPADDEVAVLLAAWRADIATDLPQPVRPVGYSADISPNGLWAVGLARAGRTAGQPRGWGRMLLTAAAVVLALAGTVTIAAGSAGPGSPLWSITRVLYQDRAQSRIAEQDAQRKIDQARQAVRGAHYTDAQRLLDEATTFIAQVRDQAVARRLLAEVEAVRGLLPGAHVPSTQGGPSGSPGVTPGPTPGTPSPTGTGVVPPVVGSLLSSIPIPHLSLPPLLGRAENQRGPANETLP
jgi:hypothetical protein